MTIEAPVTVSVVSHGHGAMLTALLHDLAALPSLAGAQVIVTRNIPGDDIRAEDFPALQIEVIDNPTPRGFGANHNQAFQRCRGAWFAILNPDLRLQDADPFPVLLDEAARDPKLGLIAPRIVNARGEAEDAIRGNLTFISLFRRAVFKQRSPLRPEVPAVRGQPFYWLAGMFLLVRRDVMAEIQGFDERYFLYCEDYDLCARLYLEGYALRAIHHTQATHLAQRDSHRKARNLYWHVSSLLRVWTSSAFWRLVFKAPHS